MPADLQSILDRLRRSLEPLLPVDPLYKALNAAHATLDAPVDIDLRSGLSHPSVIQRGPNSPTAGPDRLRPLQDAPHPPLSAGTRVLAQIDNSAWVGTAGRLLLEQVDPLHLAPAIAHLQRQLGNRIAHLLQQSVSVPIRWGLLLLPGDRAERINPAAVPRNTAIWPHQLQSAPFDSALVEEILLLSGVDGLNRTLSSIPSEHPRRTRITATAAEGLARALVDTRVRHNAGITGRAAVHTAAQVLDDFIAQHAPGPLHPADPYFQSSEPLLRLHALRAEARLVQGKDPGPLDPILHLTPGRTLLWPETARRLLTEFFQVPEVLDVARALDQGRATLERLVEAMDQSARPVGMVHVAAAVNLEVTVMPLRSVIDLPVTGPAPVPETPEARATIRLDTAPVHEAEAILDALELDFLRDDLARLLIYHQRAEAAAAVQLALLHDLPRGWWTPLQPGHAASDSSTTRLEPDRRMLLVWSRTSRLQGTLSDHGRIQVEQVLEPGGLTSWNRTSTRTPTHP